MMNPKHPPVRDRAYLDSVREMDCVICGASPCDPAHIRHGLGGGMGMKPGDDLVLPLCHQHHRQQHEIGELNFWARIDETFRMKCIKAYAKQLYREARP